MILCTVLSTTYAIKILRSYKVNYPFIFDLDPHYKVTYMQLLRVSLMLLTIWAFCFLGQLFIIKLAYVFPQPVAAFALILTIAFLMICFAPFHCLYLRARKELLVVLYHIVISPFGLVRFKHFFLADIITSFVVPLKDVGYIVCFFFNGLWLQSDTPSPNNFIGLKWYVAIVPLLPFWFRLAQCFVRYKETNLKAHLVNGGKYFSCLCIQLSAAFKVFIYQERQVQVFYPASDFAYWIFIPIALVSTIYCLVWDYYMDWGLFRSDEKGKKYLRPKILFPTWFYYYAMISNMFFRFFWVLGVIKFSDPINKSQLILFIQALVEGFRRSQWALIRIENENCNNFERYRTILQIPAFKDDQEEEEETNIK